MATAKGQGRNGNGRGRQTGAARSVPLKETILSDYDAGWAVQQRILDEAEKNGYREQCLFAIKIAVEEAIVNAIKHGNKQDRTKHVIIEATISPVEAEITIEDEGPGFVRSSVPDPLAEENLEKPSGRGLLLIESYMTKVSWDHGGRRLRMIKRRADHTHNGCKAHE